MNDIGGAALTGFVRVPVCFECHIYGVESDCICIRFAFFLILTIIEGSDFLSFHRFCSLGDFS